MPHDVTENCIACACACAGGASVRAAARPAEGAAA